MKYFGLSQPVNKHGNGGVELARGSRAGAEGLHSRHRILVARPKGSGATGRQER